MGIVDYKTGRKNNTHKKQLNIYEEALKNMGIITLEKILIYTDKKIEVEIFLNDILLYIQLKTYKFLIFKQLFYFIRLIITSFTKN